MVYGVTRIALPSCDWGDPQRTGEPLCAGDNRRIGDLRNLETETFVAGAENRLAVPALERLFPDNVEAELPSADLFNPLVLQGPTGTGKSQLARGIIRRWSTQLGESAVEYITAIDFARQLRAAREAGELHEFRERLANLQLFVLEDLHRLPHRVFVQRELRDALDELLAVGAIVVVTAQQPPATMAGLEAGLRDRLAGGLTVRLQPPNVETRRELLELASEARGVQLDDGQLQQLSQKIEGSAAQLFRAVAEYELAPDIDFPNSTVRPPLKLKQIIRVVAHHYSLTQAAMCSAARRKSLVYARGIAIYLARTLTDLSYAQIGQALGRRDHTTVMHACSTTEKRLATDASAQHDVEELKRILTAV